jgi:hypothetical protein
MNISSKILAGVTVTDAEIDAALAPSKPFWVSLKFWVDHCDRAPSDTGEAGMCKELRRSKTRALIQGTAEQIDCLRGDAAFYAEGNVDDCPGLVRSARGVLAALPARDDRLERADSSPAAASYGMGF